MSGRKRRSERDDRRRTLGQNFLVDRPLVDQFISDIGIVPGELVIDLGAGSGALTIPLAAAGARVWAVERDDMWAHQLKETTASSALDVRVIRADLRAFRFPKEPFRVVANPPFNLTTETLSKLLDQPNDRLRRVDLILQREVVRKHATEPPTSLRTAAWAPWWQFSMGRVIPARAFRPRPSVDAAVLSASRRQPSVLPDWLALRFAETLRPAWQRPNREAPSGRRPGVRQGN